MIIRELFENDTSILKNVRNNIFDILTPLMANNIPYISMDSMIEKLKDMKLGITVDRGLVLHLLNPKSTDIIKKIENDKIYLTNSSYPDRVADEDTAEKDKKRVRSSAIQKAKKSIKDRYS